MLFVKDLAKMTSFYTDSLGMNAGKGDEHHAVLWGHGFELVVHQIPKHIAETIEISDPPLRREGGAIRLDYPVESVAVSRTVAKSLGGDIAEEPPAWAERGTNFYLGHDPEGNVFGVSQHGAP